MGHATRSTSPLFHVPGRKVRKPISKYWYLILVLDIWNIDTNSHVPIKNTLCQSHLLSPLFAPYVPSNRTLCPQSEPINRANKGFFAALNKINKINSISIYTYSRLDLIIFSCIPVFYIRAPTDPERRADRLHSVLP